MKIHSNRAFWILEFFRQHETVLDFGGRILGEDAVCPAIITQVHPNDPSISLRLLSDSESESFEVAISLHRASFFLSQLGDPTFESLSGSGWHSVLQIAFPDLTILVIAERVG